MYGYSSTASIYLNSGSGAGAGDQYRTSSSYGSGYPKKYTGSAYSSSHYEPSSGGGDLGPLTEDQRYTGSSSHNSYQPNHYTSKSFAYSGASGNGSGSHLNTSYYRPVNHRSGATAEQSSSSSSANLNSSHHHHLYTANDSSYLSSSRRALQSTVAPATTTSNISAAANYRRRLSDALSNSSSSSLSSGNSFNSTDCNHHSSATLSSSTFSSGYGSGLEQQLTSSKQSAQQNGSRSSVLSRCLPKPIASTCSSILSRFSKLKLSSGSSKVDDYSTATSRIPSYGNSSGLYGSASSSYISASTYSSSSAYQPKSTTTLPYTSSYHPRGGVVTTSKYSSSGGHHHHHHRLLLPSGSSFSLSSSASSSDEYLHLPPVYPKQPPPTRDYHFRYPFSSSAALGNRTPAARDSHVSSNYTTNRGYPASITRTYNVTRSSYLLPSTTPYRAYLTAKKSVSRNFTRCDNSGYGSGSSSGGTAVVQRRQRPLADGAYSGESAGDVLSSVSER